MKKHRLQQSEKLKAEKDECMWLQELNFKIRNIAIVDDDDEFTAVVEIWGQSNTFWGHLSFKKRPDQTLFESNFIF